MEENQNSWPYKDSQSSDQVTIWSVRRKLFVSYFVLFTLLFILISGVAVWLEWPQTVAGADWPARLMAAIGVASARVLWLAAFSIITVEAGNMIAEYFIVEWRRKAEARRKEAAARGEATGRQEQHAEWLAWYQRQQAAFREGHSFNEPPPAGPGEKKGK